MKKGDTNSGSFKEGQIPWNKGVKHPSGWSREHRLGKRGKDKTKRKPSTEEKKKKISAFQQGITVDEWKDYI